MDYYPFRIVGYEDGRFLQNSIFMGRTSCLANAVENNRRDPCNSLFLR